MAKGGSQIVHEMGTGGTAADIWRVGADRADENLDRFSLLIEAHGRRLLSRQTH